MERQSRQRETGRKRRGEYSRSTVRHGVIGDTKRRKQMTRIISSAHQSEEEQDYLSYGTAICQEVFRFLREMLSQND